MGVPPYEFSEIVDGGCYDCVWSYPVQDSGLMGIAARSHAGEKKHSTWVQHNRRTEYDGRE